jgi:hypothetical protein
MATDSGELFKPEPVWVVTDNATSQELGDQERKNKRADDFS